MRTVKTIAIRCMNFTLSENTVAFDLALVGAPTIMNSTLSLSTPC